MHIQKKDSTEESIDAEAALEIKELQDDWANVSLISPTNFNIQTSNQINRNMDGELWVETSTNQEKLQWIVDTGSLHSFIISKSVKELTNLFPNSKIYPYKESTKHRGFNNNNISIKGELHLDIKSGPWSAKQCNILAVEKKTNNIMVRSQTRNHTQRPKSTG